MILLIRRVVAALVMLGFSLTSHAASVWFADENALYRVDGPTNQISHTVLFDHARSMAVDGISGGVWAASDKYLVRFDATGEMQLNLDLNQLGLNKVEHISANAYDESVWVSADNAILHFDRQGHLLGKWGTKKIRQIVVSLDESVWLLGNKNLYHVNTLGSVLGSWDLHAAVHPEPKYLALDSIGDRIWLAGEKRLTQLDLKIPSNVLTSISVKQGVQDIALDEQTGTMWVLGKTTVATYSREGSLLRSIDLKALGIQEAENIAFDNEAKAAWIGHKKGLTRFSTDLALTASIPIEKDVVAISASTFTVLPTLTLIQPPSDALTTNPKPAISLMLGATCMSLSCDFLPSYYSHYKLNAFLNGIAIGDSFLYESVSGYSTFQPVSDLPEGVNRFTVYANDRFGHSSNIIDSTFTVDTIAPKFISIIPATGSVVNVSIVTIRGSIDDAEGVVVLENLEGWNGVGQNPTKQAFSYQVTLRPGSNTLKLIASDKAGNIANATLSLTYIPISSLSLDVASPVVGASVVGDSVNVFGTFQGPANTGITVNGLVANISGNKFAASNVSLESGSNTLTVTATTVDGITVTKTIIVTSTGAAPYRVSADPPGGVAPLGVTFSIDNYSTSTVQRIDVDFEGDGVIDLTTADAASVITHTYALPGIFPATVVISDSEGRHVQTVPISVQDPTQMDQMFKALWNGMNNALIAKNKAKALEYLNNHAKVKYGPVFDALMPYFAGIVGSYSPLQRVSISADIGEYAVNRTIRGVNNIFLIYFLKDADGVWRLDAM